MSERDRLGTFLVFLQERRALYGPGEMLTREDIRISLGKILAECTAYIEALPQGAAAAAPVHHILRACRQFSSIAESIRGVEFYIALGTFRGGLADPIARLGALYATELTQPLARTVSSGNKNSDPFGS